MTNLEKDETISTTVDAIVERGPVEYPCKHAMYRRHFTNSLKCDKLDRRLSDKYCLICRFREQP
jgi:hypothetical protein